MHSILSSQLKTRSAVKFLRTGPSFFPSFKRTVHFKVAKHDANPVPQAYKTLSSAKQLLDVTGRQKATEVLQTSLVNPDFSTIRATDNGFVDTVRSAYNHHHNLVLRPDDVWIAILSQFSFYVNAHSEELRTRFVAHEGKKALVVKSIGTRYTVDHGYIAQKFTDKIHENLVDKDLKDWILPDFTTTSNTDTVVCAVLMMATFKSYFEYVSLIICGIPSVTLEGEKKDWEKLLFRLDKLKEFGEEPTAWAALLRPILTRFVKAFDGEQDLNFWGTVCHHHSGGSGPTYLSGWITAFCVWNGDGQWQGPPLSNPKKKISLYTGEEVPRLALDGISYPIIQSTDVPSGLCGVDVKLDDNGMKFDCKMVSGHLAMQVEGQMKDTVRPLPSWFMFIE